MPTTNLKAFQDLVASHAAPFLYDPKRPVQLGPDNYNATQSVAYSEQWFFEISGTTVTMGRQDGLGFPTTTVSTLYDSAFEADHLTGCFDDVSKEVLAWDLGKNSVSGKKEFRVGHFVAGVETRATIEGFNPVAFNTWPIDGDAATAGDAETGVFYLREKFPYIFFRTKGDDFATEYVVVRSSSSPFALHSAAINGIYLEVRGLDVGHRKTAWRSIYEPPQLPEELVAALEFTTGLFESVIVTEEIGPDAAAATLAFVTGEFVNTVITEDAGTDSAIASLAFVTGLFESVLIPTETVEEALDASLTFTTGEHTLTAKTTEDLSESIETSLEFTTGLFEIP